jgi:hypothetical protein
MTGRGAGFCAGYAVSGFANRYPGRGFGGGFGRGRGRRNRYRAAGPAAWARQGSEVFPSAPAASREQEIEALKAQADQFRTALEEIQNRIEELETK